MQSGLTAYSHETSILMEGILRAQVGSQNRLFHKTARGTLVCITIEDIQKLIPVLKPSRQTMLSVNYREQRKRIFHLYRGGDKWIPTLPLDVAQPGDSTSISAGILTVPEFINDIPSMDFVNDTDLNWVAEKSQLTECSLNGKELALRFVQEPPIGRDGVFDVTGLVSDSLGTGSVSGPYLDIQITDIIGLERTMRIYFNGTDPA